MYQQFFSLCFPSCSWSDIKVLALISFHFGLKVAKAHCFLKPDYDFTSPIVREHRLKEPAPPLPQRELLCLGSRSFPAPSSLWKLSCSFTSFFIVCVLFKFYCFHIWMAQLSCGIKTMCPNMCPRWTSCLPFDLNFCLVNLCGLDVVRNIFWQSSIPTS